MLKTHSFTNIGSRNKGCMWEYITACAYRDLDVPGSKYKLTKLFAFGEDQSNQHCLAIDEIASNVDTMIRELEAGLYTRDFFKSLRDYYEEPLQNFSKFVSQKSADKFSNEELLQAFDMFSDAAARTYPPMLIGFAAAYLDSYYTNKLKGVANLDETELVTLKTNLFTMPRASVSEREEDAIYAIVKNIKDKGLSLADVSVKAGIKNLADSFGWFHMEYAGEPHTEKHYAEILEKRLSQPLPAYNLAEAKKVVIDIQNNFFRKYKNEELEKLTFAMQEFAFILDDSKRATVHNHFLIYPLLAEIAKRASIKLIDVYFLTGPEIHNALENFVNMKLVEERKKHRAVFLHDGVIEVLTGKEAKDVSLIYIEKQEVKLNQEEVKGIVAFPGYYKGKVCVVLNPDDHSKFKDGDVLVTRDGSAEFTYFLQHAGAIVADQGGIISHAAIVARESKVPAVLSTKVGTKIFKDGDIVEVDAKKGIVRIIK
jgi:phosphohistidine swiveling domain-containing protein